MAKSTNKENLHENHRKRLRALLETTDFNTISDVQILEYLITLSIPRGNTNDQAHRLLNTFGSILESIEAEKSQLMSIQGIGKETASFFGIISKVFRRIYESVPMTKGKVHLETPNEIVSFFFRFFVHKSKEEFYIAFLTAKDDLIAIENISKGLVNTVSIELSKIYELIARHNPSKIILAHNHPNGMANPSASDFETTSKIVDIASAFSVIVADHLILAKDQYLSFKTCGYLDEISSDKRRSFSCLSNKLLNMGNEPSAPETKPELPDAFCLEYPNGIGDF